ncbi:hypothetical protein [Streptomyces sp. NPDC004065]|uniref:hypothetical protein n=1 Tax=Streptomyces sp. NPDC004065 TaxID=3364689 RepID=UPI00384BF425
MQWETLGHRPSVRADRPNEFLEIRQNGVVLHRIRDQLGDAQRDVVDLQGGVGGGLDA